MLSTRWVKLVRDLEATPVRIAVMLFAIAIGVFCFALMLGTYAVLNHEVSKNISATHPASAYLEIENFDTRLLDAIKSFPNVADAQAGLTLSAELILEDDSVHHIKIYVVEDFGRLNIDKFFYDTGAWPPTSQSLLLERYSLAQANLKLGDSVRIGFQDGSQYKLQISGTVHDPAMAIPSAVAFAYVDSATLQSLGINSRFSELKILVQKKPLDVAAIEATASQLAQWLNRRGQKVSSIRIPPPGEHPHQRIMFGVLGVFLAFSCIAVVLSAVLTSTLVDNLMAKQIRQVGVMKAIGANTTQIIALYLIFIVILSLIATSLGGWCGIWASRAASTLVLGYLNFNFYDQSLPISFYIAVATAGVLIPVIAAAIPILRVARNSVRDAFREEGMKSQYFELNRNQSQTFRQRCLSRIDPSLLMALRNSFRQKGRLLLVLSVLTSAGAIFIGGFNLRFTAQQHLISAAAERHYDLEVVLEKPTDRNKIYSVIRSVPGIDQVEAWAMARVGRKNSDGFTVEKTFSDGGHGAVVLNALPEASNFLSIKLHDGSWLNTIKWQSENAVVLNRKALEIFPGAKVGSHIAVGAQGREISLQLQAIAEQKMTGGLAYVSLDTFQKLMGQSNEYIHYRVVLSDHDDKNINEIANNIQAVLAQQNIKVRQLITENWLRYEVDAHFTLLLNALLAVAVLMALVGALGLASVMSAQIAERTREFGIMRSIGASSATILRNQIVEGMFVSLMSAFFATIFSLFVSFVISNVIGNIIFDESFPFAFSLQGIWIWCGVLFVATASAIIYPAKKAVSISIRESLSI